MRVLPLLAILAGLAGCVDAYEGTDPGLPGFRLSGAFSAEATQADYDRAAGLVASHGGAMRLLESFPPQFVADGFDQVACQKAREALLEEPHVATVGGCTPA